MSAQRMRNFRSRRRAASDIRTPDGCRMTDLLGGVLEVSPHNLGERNACEFCGALLWSKETTTICCHNGKVNLEPLPRPLAQLLDLYTSDASDASVFPKYIRTLNNALFLSSVKVGEGQRNSGFQPTVIIQVRFQTRFS